MGLTRRLLNMAGNAVYWSGGARLLDWYWGTQRITVVLYHRINFFSDPQFPYVEENVSCTPEMFERHVAFYKKHFNVIDLTTLVDYLDKGRPLPPRPCLITFDDGYLDNYLYAYPILKKYETPAVFFLFTGALDHPKVPWWDNLTRAIKTSPLSAADLPILGQVSLETPAKRMEVANTLRRRLKKLPRAETLERVAQVSAALQVEPLTHDPDLFMTWDQVREVIHNGIACQPHTDTHPILTRVSNEEMAQELRTSFRRIQEETGERPISFAYPNGTPADYNEECISTLRALGCKVAFTTSYDFAYRGIAAYTPFNVPRIGITNFDDFGMFGLKTMGALMFANRFTGLYQP